jgi:AraC-like DNA-binding protein
MAEDPARRASIRVSLEPVPVTRPLRRRPPPLIIVAMTDETPTNVAFARHLLDGLTRFRATAISGVVPHAAGLFSYCALSRERLLAVRLQRPIVGTVVSGAKEVWRGDVPERLPAGTLFVLPAQIDLDIVNEPDERSGLYRSLILEIDPDDVPLLASPSSSRQSLPGGCSVPLRVDLVEAMVHAARAISEGPAAATIRSARLAELLALLHDVPAARPLFDQSTGERVARLVRAEPGRRWSAAMIAERLAMSESTLRRRLAAEGRSFAAVLRAERMEAARRLMDRGAASGAAAFAVGYTSRTHFARAYRAAFGGNPSRGRSVPPARGEIA